MSCSDVPNSMWVLALMPSWSLCLSPVSGAVSGWVPDASVKPWFLETGAADVLGNEFDVGLSSVPPVPALRAVLR